MTLRASRPGEVQLRNGFLGQETHQWFRQLRRLQSYVHAINAGKQTLSALTYRLELWSAILQAPGFTGGFATWWMSYPGLHAEALPRLPSAPPDQATASSIFEIFKQAYEKFESWHPSPAWDPLEGQI